MLKNSTKSQLNPTQIPIDYLYVNRNQLNFFLPADSAD